MIIKFFFGIVWLAQKFIQLQIVIMNGEFFEMWIASAPHIEWKIYVLCRLLWSSCFCLCFLCEHMFCFHWYFYMCVLSFSLKDGDYSLALLIKHKISFLRQKYQSINRPTVIQMPKQSYSKWHFNANMLAYWVRTWWAVKYIE